MYCSRIALNSSWPAVSNTEMKQNKIFINTKQKTIINKSEDEKIKIHLKLFYDLNFFVYLKNSRIKTKTKNINELNEEKLINI